MKRTAHPRTEPPLPGAFKLCIENGTSGVINLLLNASQS